MKRQQTLAFSMVLGLMLLGSISPVRGDEPDFSDVVIFATNSISLGNKTEVLGGDVVVNASGGPTLCDSDSDAELCAGDESNFAGDLVADTIVLDPKNDVAGTFSCNDGAGSNDGTTVTCGGLFLPVFTEGELPDTRFPDLDPGASDVDLPDDGQVTLDAGDYADITTGNKATIVFTGGTYNIASVLAGDEVSFEFEAPTELRILGTLGVGNKAFLGPGGGSTASASSIEISVGGTNDDPNDPSSEPEAVNFGDEVTLEAVFWVPNGTLRLGNKLIAAGAFAARDVSVGDEGQFLLSSQPQPPPVVIADPQDVFTDGDQNLVITLTASDPENDDLTFSIVGGLPQTLIKIETPPGSETAGTLLADLTEIPLITGGTCSVSGDPCVDFTFSSDCPGVATGETCVADPSQDQSATITYDPANADDVPTSFTFKATDGTTIAMANVRINPILCDDGSAPPCDPPPAVATVVASDIAAETRRDTSFTITLDADAPCDGACDGAGIDSDTPLTFSILGGTLPLTTANGGTVDILTQGTEVPQRSASVSYTPADGFVSPPIDSFDFEACGTINAIQVCDMATVTVEVTGPVLLAEDVEDEVEINAEVAITLIGNSGGVGDEGKSSPVRQLAALKAVGLAEASAVGAVVDTDFDGFGDQVVAGSGGFVDGTDFETPVLGSTEDRRVIDPYVFGDTVMGIDGGGGTHEVGLVKNSATSACVDPSNDDQKLGIGTAGTGSIGFASAAVRATFPESLPAGSEVSVDFQTGLGVPIRIRLFDSLDQAVGSAVGTASPAAGQCGLPGTDRAVTTLTAVATGSAVYAVMDLDTSTGGVVFVLDNFSFSTGGGNVSAGLDTPSTGERRIQIEWDVTGFPSFGVVSASVTVQTVKGEDDTLDTSFFAGNAEQDEVVTPSDFEAAADAVPGALMPVPTAPVGTEGTFTFDVLNALLDALNSDDPLAVFSIQGRVDLQSTGQGLQVKTDPLPTLQFATPPPIPPSALVFTVLSAPSLGTLFDSTGAAVVIGQALPSPDLTFVSGGTGGTTSFTYEVEEFGIIGTGEVFLTLNDGCADVGRPPGCTPGQ